MSWLRTGDNAATNPIVLRVLAFVRGSTAKVNERDVIKAELFGTVSMWATLSTSHDQDYVVSYGTACGVSGVRTDRLLDLAVRAGYMTKVDTAPGDEERWLIINDPQFLHMRTKAEKEFEAQRRQDAANPALTVPVRLRDGDNCRYCGKTVYWGDRKSQRGATYDHRDPDNPTTPETLYVSCRSCNSARGDDEDADVRVPPLPAPARPYYSPGSLKWLGKHGQFVTERAEPAPASSADPADSQAAGSGSAGTGRDGPGRDSSGTTGSAEPRRRGRRGGRNRKRSPMPPTHTTHLPAAKPKGSQP